MRAKATARCTNCRRLQARVDALEAELADLKQLVAQLGQQLAAARKDSSTSSKPPSSDIVKPPRPPTPEGQDKRRIGGQPGHPKHERSAFPPEAINDGSFDHRPGSCPGCGHGLRPALTIPPRVVQQVDLREVPLAIQEHRAHSGWCPACRVMYEAPLPPGITRGGLVGPSLTTLIAYLKGACHASYSTARKSLRDVVHVTISRGELARVIAKVSRALERPYQELLDDLPGQARLNVDETGHKRDGERQWTWCFRAGLYTLFKIDPTRSGDVLIGVLGAEFDGVLGCDYFSSYRRYQREFGVLLQFCLAHLIRDVKYLTTLPDARDRAYGERLREALRQLFAVIHRREELPGAVSQGQLEAARAEVNASRDPGCAGDEARWQHGEAVRGAWGELLPVRDDAGAGADEQPGGAGDPVRGDRPADHAGDAGRGGQPVVRADLDGDRDMRAAGSFGVLVPGGGGGGLVRGGRGAVAVTRRLRRRAVRW